jgi:hypothetical protein
MFWIVGTIGLIGIVIYMTYEGILRYRNENN